MQLAEEIKEPDAEDYIEANQIEEPDPGETKADNYPHVVLEPPEAGRELTEGRHLYITSDENQVLQTFLQRIVIESSVEMIEQGLVDPNVTQFTPETIKAATVVVTVLPMLLIYPFVQKYFVKGIMLGGVKE